MRATPGALADLLEATGTNRPFLMAEIGGKFEVEIFLTSDNASGCKTIKERRPTYGSIGFVSGNGAAVPGLQPSSNAKI
jgi:hypothetical protein